MRRPLVDAPPVDRALDHLVVRLQEDGAVAEVVEEGLHCRLHVQAVEPQREDAGLALAFGVEVLDLDLLLLGDGVERGVRVEQVGNEGEVELGVAGHERRRAQELAAP